MIAKDLKTLTVPMVAEILGIHKVDCYQLIKDGKIPAIRLGKRIRIREQSLRSWMKSHEQDGFDPQ